MRGWMRVGKRKRRERGERGKEEGSTFGFAIWGLAS